MAFPAGVRKSGTTDVLRTGVVVVAYTKNPGFEIIIERAPDVAGSPGTPADIGVIAPGESFYIDLLALDGLTYHYRMHHRRSGHTDGDETAWHTATPVVIPTHLPVPPPEPVVSFELHVDPVDGEVLLYIDGSSRIKSVNWELDISAPGSEAFPTAPLTGGTNEDLDADGNADIATSQTATPSQIVSAVVEYYDETGSAGIRIATLRRRMVRAPEPVDCNPNLDEDDGVWNVQPQRTGSSLSVRYFVTTNGTDPTLGEVQGGTISTLDDILNVRTSTVDGEVVKVGFLAYSANNGTGTEGPLRIRRGTYHTNDNRPNITHSRYVTGVTNQEGVRLVAKDDGATVRIFYRQFNEGGATGSYTDTGLVSDPAIVDVVVVKPVEGGTRRVLEFYAEDAAGNKSTDISKKVYIDGDAVPSGTAIGRVDPTDGSTYADVSSTDSDSGSYRIRLSKSAYTDPDGDGGEFAGATFPTEETFGATWDLASGEQLFGVVLFYRTTSTTFATQDASIKSPKIRFTLDAPGGGSGGATGNYCLITKASYRYVSATTRKVFLNCTIGPDTVTIDILRTDAAGDPIVSDQVETPGGSGVRQEEFTVDQAYDYDSVTPYITTTPKDAASAAGQSERADFGSGADDGEGGVRVLSQDGSTVTLTRQALQPLSGEGMEMDAAGKPYVLMSDLIKIQSGDPGFSGTQDAGKLWIDPV